MGDGAFHNGVYLYPVFPTGQVGQQQSLAWPMGILKGLAGPVYRPYRLSTDCLIDRPGPAYS